MVGDRSGYSLYFYTGEYSDAGNFEPDNFEHVAERFQGNLVQPTMLYELPPDIDDFVGRSTEIHQVLHSVHQSIHRTQSNAIVVVITGRAGVGKSALAIYLAHRLRSSFLDAQLYINLRGAEQYPQHSLDIITRLLRSQGIEESNLPIDAAERLKLFQSVLDNKHIILVLDNVENESQLDTLLPKTSAGVILITSRNPLTSVAGVSNLINLDLTELSEAEAVELLHKLVNQDTIRFTLNVAKEVVQLCHRLPLAIRLIAGVLKRQASPIELIEQLRNEYTRIEPLALSHKDVRPGFVLNYQQLDPKTAQLLRLLGLLTESHFTLPVAAALLEVGLDHAGQLVGQLVDLKLVRRMGGEHYCMVHDIVRLLARGALAAEDPTEVRQAARLRVSHWYLHRCQLMSLGLDPQTRRALVRIISQTRRQSLAKIEQHVLSGALTWFEMERVSILTAMEWAFQAESWEIVIAFAESLVLFFELYIHWFDWKRTHQMAVEAVRHLGNRQQEAKLLNNLGNCYLRQNQLDRSQACYNQSISLFQEFGTSLQVAKTTTNLGMLHLQAKQHELAMEFWKDALMRLPESAEQQQLKQWMQVANPMVWQRLNTEMDAPPAPRGLFQSVGEAIKRLILE